jgi:trimeric autotransporter adhesin
MANFYNSSAAVLFGTSGADYFETNSNNGLFTTIYGGLGNDIYFIDAFYNNLVSTPEDVVIEALGGGIDTVNLDMYYNQALGLGNNTGYTLSNNVENLEADLFSDGGFSTTFNLTGNNLANKITVLSANANAKANLDGGAGNDTLIGGVNDDTLIGGIGADVMQGGNGNDFYYVDNVLDTVIEGTGAGSGYDRVNSTVTFTLGANIDRLDLQGSTNINGTGNALGNIMYGNSGNNTLNGLAGGDFMQGNDGNDTLNGGAGFDALYGGSGNDVLNGGDDGDTLRGQSGNDSLNGGAGNDRLYGNYSGNGFIDKLDGGAGDDRYYISNANDVIADTGVGGNDTVYAYSQLTGDLGAGVENLQLINFGSVLIGRGNALGNVITGNTYNNSLFGLAGDDILNGDSGNDILEGGDGNDVLDGGTGADLMRGGNGNDNYFVDNASDLAIEITSGAAGGVDTVFSSADFGLTANVENLTLTGAATIGVGNASNNLITGANNDNNDILVGKYGADVLNGGAGNDALYGDDFSVTPNGGNDTLNGGLGADGMTGGIGNDVFIVDDAGDIINELAGVGEGIDRVESSVTFSLVDTDGAGLNGGNVENLTLTGSSSINGTGNALNNVITGNSGDNSLSGGIGADTMTGGLGSDIYVVDDINDKVIELAGQGTDTVQSSLVTASLALLTNIENLNLTGAAFNGTGNALNNTINGNYNANVLNGGAGNDSLYGGGLVINDTLNGGDGNDTLDGGAGIDSMTGGLGNDTYYIDNLGDIIIENAASGTDALIWNLAGPLSLTGSYANIENGTLKYGSAATNLTGNGFNNMLIGNELNNSIDGGAGNDTLDGGAPFGGSNIDTLIGGLGNDVFIVDDFNDDVREAIGGGIDRVESSVSFELDDNPNKFQIENITLTGYGSIYADGNDLANLMIGNSGNNVLYAYGGNDTLIGGAGNDSLRGYSGSDSMVGGLGDDEYYVDVAGDIVVELAGQGIDTVYSSINFSLALLTNVENLALGGTAINGTGNALNNSINGNGIANNLNGGAGNDYLFGGNGTDTLIGGLGNDTLDGGSDNDNMAGGAGNDDMYGSAGLDTLIGGDGNDTLNGGIGNDTLTGGAGNDAFMQFGPGMDTITDFVSGFDILDLGSLVGLTFTGGGNSLTATEFVLGANAAGAEDRIIYNQANGDLFYDSDGTGLAAQVQIFDFTGVPPTLSSADIFA